MNALRLVIKARKSIGGFCASECRAFCCKKGLLKMNKAEMTKLTQQKAPELLRNGRLTLTNEYTLNLTGGCPSLKDNNCSIHASKLRPTACKEYPLFTKEIDGKTHVFAASQCHAVQAGKLYPYLRRLRNEGCILIESTSTSKLNLHTFDST